MLYNAEAENDAAPNINGLSPFQLPSNSCSSVNLAKHPPPIQMASDCKLCIYYQNVRGLRTKLDAFFLAVNEADFDVVVLTETWLDEKIYSAQLFGYQYEVFRNDRNHLNSTKKRGGGVLIAIRRLNGCLDSALVSNTLEHLWVQINTYLQTEDLM